MHTHVPAIGALGMALMSPSSAFVPLLPKAKLISPRPHLGPSSHSPSSTMSYFKTAVWARRPGGLKTDEPPKDATVISDEDQKKWLQQMESDRGVIPPPLSPQQLPPQQQKGQPSLYLPAGPNRTLILSAVISALLLGGLGLIIAYFTGINVLSQISLNPRDFALGAVLSLPLVAADAKLQETQEDTASEVYALSIFGTKTPFPLVALVAAVVTFATGLGEETLFRGVIQQGLVNNIGGLFGLGLASVIFALAHRLGPSDVSFIFGTGLWMGAAYLFTGGNLTVCIALHAVYDAILLLKAYRRGREVLGRGR